MAVTRVTKDEIQKSRQHIIQAQNNTPKKNIEKQPDYLIQIKDSDIIYLFNDFGYLSHERSKEFIHVDCLEFEVFFNDFTLVSSKKSQSQIESQKLSNINAILTPFKYSEFEKYCDMMGVTVENAIYNYIYDKLFKYLPYYVENKVRFDKNNIDLVELITNKTNYKNLIKPSINKQYAVAELNNLEHKYGTTNPEKISKFLNNI